MILYIRVSTRSLTLTQRIVHFSDTHVLSLKGVQLRELLNKRITGAVNLALNRAKHYQVEVFEQLLDAVVAVQPDHSICTGDLVNLALTPEFVRVHELLSDRFGPHQLTLVPGNHDYYTKEASLAGRFEEYFDEYLPHELDGGTVMGLRANWNHARYFPGQSVFAHMDQVCAIRSFGRV